MVYLMTNFLLVHNVAHTLQMLEPFDGASAQTTLRESRFNCVGRVVHMLGSTGLHRESL